MARTTNTITFRILRLDKPDEGIDRSLGWYIETDEEDDRGKCGAGFTTREEAVKDLVTALRLRGIVIQESTWEQQSH